MKLNIGFSGDVAFSEYSKDIPTSKDNIDKSIYDFLNSNDYNILNFESPITDSTLTTKAALAHKSSDNSLMFVKKNFKNVILNLANNHMMDYCQKGLLDTVKILKKEKITYIGAGRNLDDATKTFILGKDVKVGIIAFQYKDKMIATPDSPGTSHDSHLRIIKYKMKELKKVVDWIVVIYHGGEEFMNVPMPYTRSFYKKILKAGADVIVAHHPHTVQGYETVDKKMIFYSLGNFIFDTDFQRQQKNTDEGVLLRISFDKDNYSFEPLYLKKDRDNNKIRTVKENKHFVSIKKGYGKKWRKEARRYSEIQQNKKDLKIYRNRYVVNNLHIEKAKIDNIISFEELVKKNYFKELDTPVIFESTGIIARIGKRINKKFKKFTNKKSFYIKYANLVKW